MSGADKKFAQLPDDSEALKAMVRSLLVERERQERRAEELRVEMLRLQLELERYKKWYYGPRADRLQSSGDLAQMLLDFAAELEPGGYGMKPCGTNIGRFAHGHNFSG